MAESTFAELEDAAIVTQLDILGSACLYYGAHDTTECQVIIDREQGALGFEVTLSDARHTAQFSRADIPSPREGDIITRTRDNTSWVMEEELADSRADEWLSVWSVRQR